MQADGDEQLLLAPAMMQPFTALVFHDSGPTQAKQASDPRDRRPIEARRRVSGL